MWSSLSQTLLPLANKQFMYFFTTVLRSLAFVIPSKQQSQSNPVASPCPIYQELTWSWPFRDVPPYRPSEVLCNNNIPRENYLPGWSTAAIAPWVLCHTQLNSPLGCAALSPQELMLVVTTPTGTPLHAYSEPFCRPTYHMRETLGIAHRVSTATHRQSRIASHHHPWSSLPPAFAPSSTPRATDTHLAQGPTSSSCIRRNFVSSIVPYCCPCTPKCTVFVIHKCPYLIHVSIHCVETSII